MSFLHIRAIVAGPDTTVDAFHLEMQKGALSMWAKSRRVGPCATQRKAKCKH